MVYAKTTWVTGNTPISAANLNNAETQYDTIVKVGEIKMYAGSTAPTDFLLCNGSSYNAATYAALFAVTSYRFGGSLSTFQVPDLRGKFVAGYNSTSADYDIVGESHGSSGITLTTTEIPPHNHQYYAAYSLTGQGAGNYPGMSLSQNYDASTDYTGYSGGGGAHNNVPQYVTVNYIIRYQ